MSKGSQKAAHKKWTGLFCKLLGQVIRKLSTWSGAIGFYIDVLPSKTFLYRKLSMHTTCPEPCGMKHYCNFEFETIGGPETMVHYSIVKKYTLLIACDIFHTKIVLNIKTITQSYKLWQLNSFILTHG